jgi:hypothetical protein
MRKFVLFDNSIVNIDCILCLFPNEISEWLLEEGEDQYLITMRLTNGSSLNENFKTIEERDERFNNIKKEFLYDE